MLSAESKTTRTATSLDKVACSSRMRRNYELCYICEVMDSLDIQAFDNYKDVNKQNLCVQVIKLVTRRISTRMNVIVVALPVELLFRVCFHHCKDREL